MEASKFVTCCFITLVGGGVRGGGLARVDITNSGTQPGFIGSIPSSALVD